MSSIAKAGQHYLAVTTSVLKNKHVTSNTTSDPIVDLHHRLVTMEYSNNGRVAGLIETPAPGVHEVVGGVQVLMGRGFAGDHPEKSFWKGAYIPGREVSACAAEMLALFGIAPSVVGDNLITHGIALHALQPGQRVQVGEVVLARSHRDHRPCDTFRERTSDAAFRLAARGFRGALFVVEKAGMIRQGDNVTLLDV